MLQTIDSFVIKPTVLGCLPPVVVILAEVEHEFGAVGLWLLVIITIGYTLPTFVGPSSLPPWFNDMFSSKLNYGLDLQGGLELRYTVDWKKAIADNGRKLGDAISSRLVTELAKKDNKNADDLPREEWNAYAARAAIDVPDYTAIRVKFADQATVDALGTELDTKWFYDFGIETLKLEDEFNEKAGFNADEDELPSFFYDEKLAPTNKQARHHFEKIRELRQDWYAEQAVGAD